MSVSRASRAAGRFRWVEDAFADVRYAVRSLWKDRVFAITAFLTLGVGIAATIAMFAVVDAVLVRPLPFPGSDRLVAAAGGFEHLGEVRVSLTDSQE